jgi:hypothetical protein
VALCRVRLAWLTGLFEVHRSPIDYVQVIAEEIVAKVAST